MAPKQPKKSTTAVLPVQPSPRTLKRAKSVGASVVTENVGTGAKTAQDALNRRARLSKSRTEQSFWKSAEQAQKINTVKLLKERYADFSDHCKYTKKVDLGDKKGPVTLQKAIETAYLGRERGSRLPTNLLKLWDKAFAASADEQLVLEVKDPKDLTSIDFYAGVVVCLANFSTVVSGRRKLVSCHRRLVNGSL